MGTGLAVRLPREPVSLRTRGGNYDSSNTFARAHSEALDTVISADGAHIAYSSSSRDLDRTSAINEGFGTLDVFAWSK